jgi:sugar phosphate isomerase/epimerase
MIRHANGGARLSVSTWSLHRTLGQPAFYGPGQALPNHTHGGGLSLVEIPAALKRLDISTLEICHFHLPSLEVAYLEEMRQALEDAEVELFSLLVDAGDIVAPEAGGAETKWVESWLEVAAALGSRCVRVIAGKQPAKPQTLAAAVDILRTLARRAQQRGVRLMTENWFELTETPQALRHLLEELDGEVGLCLDFGNWKGEDKYERLEAVAGLAESCHAKPQFDEVGLPQRDDFVRCLELLKSADFAGPYTLIYDGPDRDEWGGLELESALVGPYLSAD